jgi:F-type H+-transporting ATPase subunit a
MLSVGIVAALVFAAGMLVARRVLAGLRASRAPRGALANMVEAILVYVRDEIVVPVGGQHLGHYTPLFLTYFLFILAANLMGMLPWPPLGTATGNVGVTLALGGSIYALIWILGMVHQGPLNYLRHQVPPGTPWWMWPLMFPLEIMGPLIKCFVLCIRLFANMIAGHLIIGTVLGLGAFGAGAMMPWAIALIMLVLGLPLALGISMLEVLVALIQAYVFTLLAVVFIGAAVHPEH